MFNVVGFITAAAVWGLVRGDEVDQTQNIAGLQDFVLSDETAVVNVGIGAGYFLASTLVWLGLSQLGEASTSKRRTGGGYGEQQLEQKNYDFVDSVDSKPFTKYLDRVFSVFTVSRNILINTVLVSQSRDSILLKYLLQSASFLLFWTTMRTLPDRATARVKRDGSNWEERISDASQKFMNRREVAKIKYVDLSF